MKDDKNAFQWDAYRPLVDRIPACNAQGGGGVCPGGVCPGGCLPGRVCLGGVGPGGGGVCLGGVCPGVSAGRCLPRGCLPLVQGGVYLWSGGVSQHAIGQTVPPLLWTPVKT